MARSVPESLRVAGIKNWSDLAARVGVTPTTICWLRSGRRKPSAELTEKLAAALGVPKSLVEDLLRSSGAA